MTLEKSYLLLLNGKLVPSESRRSFLLEGTKYRLPLSSRKDLREAVRGAREALTSYQETSAIQKGKHLYRFAELLESHRAELASLGVSNLPETLRESIFFAGIPDKLSLLLGSVNQVSGPYLSISHQEGMGVVGILLGEGATFRETIRLLLAVLASGSAPILLSPKKISPAVLLIGEIFAAIPYEKNLITILSGDLEELLPHFASHHDIDLLLTSALSLSEFKTLQVKAADSVKRTVAAPPSSLALLRQIVETKTLWHPIAP